MSRFIDPFKWNLISTVFKLFDCVMEKIAFAGCVCVGGGVVGWGLAWVCWGRNSFSLLNYISSEEMTPFDEIHKI